MQNFKDIELNNANVSASALYVVISQLLVEMC
jgi:hypothetical protein